MSSILSYDWSRLIWDLHMFYLLKPILFPSLSLFFQAMHLENQSVFSASNSTISYQGIQNIEVHENGKNLLNIRMTIVASIDMLLHCGNGTDISFLEL